MKTETLAEWFFPASTKTGKLIIPAPDEAVAKGDQLKGGWLRNYPHCPEGKPLVHLGPGKKDGAPGYYVRKEIIYCRR